MKSRCTSFDVCVYMWITRLHMLWLEQFSNTWFPLKLEDNNLVRREWHWNCLWMWKNKSFMRIIAVKNTSALKYGMFSKAEFYSKHALKMTHSSAKGVVTRVIMFLVMGKKLPPAKQHCTTKPAQFPVCCLLSMRFSPHLRSFNQMGWQFNGAQANGIQIVLHW